MLRTLGSRDHDATAPSAAHVASAIPHTVTRRESVLPCESMRARYSNVVADTSRLAVAPGIEAGRITAVFYSFSEHRARSAFPNVGPVERLGSLSCLSDESLPEDFGGWVEKFAEWVAVLVYDLENAERSAWVD